MQEESKTTDINCECSVVMDSEVAFGKFDIDSSNLVYDTEQRNESSDDAQLVIFDVSEATWFKSCNCVPLEDLLKSCKSCHVSCDTHKIIELPGNTICDSSQAGDRETIPTCLTSMSSPAVSVRTLEVDLGSFYPAGGEKEKCYSKSTGECKISELDEEIADPISSEPAVFENEFKTKLETSESEKGEIRIEPGKAGTWKVSGEEMTSTVRFREPTDDETLQLPSSPVNKEQFPFTKQGLGGNELESNVFKKLSKDIAHFDSAHKREMFIPVTISSPHHQEREQNSNLNTESLKEKPDSFESRVDSLTARLPKKRIVWPVCSKYPNCSICIMEVEEIDGNVSSYSKRS